MPKARVYGRTSSINVRKVLWTLAEIQVPFEHEDEWATPAGDVTSPEFKSLNPNAMVPVLKDENGILWESNAICRYLASKHGRTDLLPLSARPRGHVEKWMDWQATELNTAWRYAFMHLVRHDPKYDDASLVADSIARSNELMALLDTHLAASGPYVTGQQFTLADIVVGLSAHRWNAMPMERPRLKGVEGWLGLLKSREGAQDFLCDLYP